MMNVSAHYKAALNFSEHGSLSKYKKYSYQYCCNYHSKEICHKNVPISHSLFPTDMHPSCEGCSEQYIICVR